MEKIQMLEYIRQQVELMSKHNQIEILRILKSEDNDIILNENINGIFINLTDLSIDVLEKLNIYIEYWKKQENNLKNIESTKQKYKTIYFSKNIKDNSLVNNNVSTEQSI